MKKVIITISREYCSGGLKVGKRLAEDLGISCYDSEMFRLVSDNANMKDDIVAHDDRIKDTSLFSVAKERYHGDLMQTADEMVSMRNLYEYQSDIIQELARRESCVIVGRCSNYILRDRTDTVSVFIHAPLDFRVMRAASIHYMPESELRRYVTKVDERKADYYHMHTGEDWHDISGYELSLDTEKLGIRGCADRIRDYITIRFREGAEK